MFRGVASIIESAKAALWIYAAILIYSSTSAVLTLGMIRSGSAKEVVVLGTTQVFYMGGIGFARYLSNTQLLYGTHTESERYSQIETGSRSSWRIYLALYIATTIPIVILGIHNSHGFLLALAVLIVGYFFGYAQDLMRQIFFHESRQRSVLFVDILAFLPMALLLSLSFMGLDIAISSWIISWAIGSVLSFSASIALWSSRTGNRIFNKSSNINWIAIKWSFAAALIAYLSAPAFNLVIATMFSAESLVDYKAANLLMFPFAIVATSVPALFLSQKGSASKNMRFLNLLIVLSIFIAAIITSTFYFLAPENLINQITGRPTYEIQGLLWPVAVAAGATAMFTFLNTLKVRRKHVKSMAAAVIATSLGFTLTLFFTGLADLDFTFSLWASVAVYVLLYPVTRSLIRS